ncbi:MAG: DUF4209 domain-containing protein [Flavobacterium sp.]|uniref:DUF4209 domain-containing protein n=1 Tax=Flavobacterium sp. TaxID=239 RepID=UPI0022C0E4A8|nr:DUF4209 domain-containing protein [Flavobacterium sp.]MCZ8196674.1 DUF4209 domain-containing protein [Flavobacterium sp.]
MTSSSNPEFYNSLENFKSLSIWNIQKELQEVLPKEGNWDDNIITERKVLFLNLNNGKLISNALVTDIKGNVSDELNFNAKEYEYLKIRLEESNNSWLKSRYAHILWKKTKHKKFAESALENYSKIINEIKAEESREFTILISAILYISKTTKLDIEKVREFITELLKEMPIWIKGEILAQALHHNIIEKSELTQIANSLETYVELKNPVSYSMNQNNLNTFLHLYRKIRKSPEEIYSLFAKNEDLILEQHPNDEDFIKITYLGNKAMYLKQAKELVEYDKAMCEYNRLKTKVKLNKISIPLNDESAQKFNEYLNLKTKYLLQLSTEEILSYFSINEDILVDSEVIKKTVEGRIKNSLMYLFSTTTFDINTNFKVLSDKEKVDKQFLQSYIIAHNIQCYPLFLKVFTQGIISGKLNYYKVFSFLEAHSWYGQKTKRSISANEIDENSSWLSLLAPGLHNLFAQHELSVLLNTNRVNNFILSIDSLTLKFEGAMRDFIKLSGGNTSKDHKGEIKEQLLEELLENEIIQKYFSKKDIELFKMTFTSRGKNIRNNVAHCFMEYSDYSLQVASLIFLCILRLGKYTLE